MNSKLTYLSILFWVCVIISCKKDATSVNETPEKPVEVKITELDRPINVKATKGTWGTKVVISWTPMPLAKKYQVFKFDEVAQQYQLFKELADTTVDDLISKSLTKSFYKVKVYNSATEYSPFSDADYGYTSGQTYNKLLSFGAEGTGNGQFQYATHLEADKEGNIYVSDDGNGRIQKFDKTGRFLELFYQGIRSARGMAFFKNGNILITQLTVQNSNNYVKILDANKNTVSQWGSYGSADNQFGNIEQVTLDDEENIYIADGINNSIKKYDKTGKFLLSFGATSSGKLDSPWGVCYLKNYIYVAGPRMNAINIYDKSGKYIKSWNIGTGCYEVKTNGESLIIAGPGYIIKTDVNGEVREKIGEGQLGVIGSIAITADDQIIASDIYARKIFIYKRM